MKKIISTVDVETLAQELLELSRTYEPSPPNVLRAEPPLITKAKEVIAVAQGPMDHAIGMVSQAMETAVIRTLLYLKAIQTIPTIGSISLQDLSSITGAQAALLERLLRVVVSSGFIVQTENGEYAHSTLSLGYTNGGSMLLEMLYDEGLLALAALPRYLEAKRPDVGWVEPGGENNMTHNPMTWYAGQEGKTSFEIIAQDPARLLRFQKLMGSVAHLNPFTGVYDFIKLATPDEPERPVFVDVGGGHGHAIAAILSAHPEIKPDQCILQDRPEVVELARKQGGLPERVHFMPHDFFATQPVKHARAYHLRAIAHDLSDVNLIKVLKQIVPAMAPDSKVLIADNVIPEHGSKGMAGFMDMFMLCIGGKERTEANFREMLGEAGLKLDAVYEAGGDRTFAVVEASLKLACAPE